MIERGDLEGLVGREFPGGTYTVDPETHGALVEAIGSRREPGGVAHPVIAFYGATRGLGVTLDELFALAGASADDGPMLGEVELELRRPLLIGATYTVRGSISAVDRKQGARTGTFDVVTCRLELSDGDDVAVVVSNSYVFPRRAQ
jgi:hypothetical protein